MKKVQKEGFNVVGISIRTDNVSGKAAEQIGGLFARFLGENLQEQIKGKLGSDIYSVYTHYEGDHTKPYDVILGCKTENLAQIPEGMVGIYLESGEYAAFTAKGNLQEGVVFKTWQKIWEMDLDRKYTADYEVYGEKTANPEDAEVDIFIAI